MNTNTTIDNNKEMTSNNVVIISLKEQSEYDKYFIPGNDWNKLWIVSCECPQTKSNKIDGFIESTPPTHSKSSSRSSDFSDRSHRSEPYAHKSNRTRRTNSYNKMTKNTEYRRNGNRRNGRNSPGGRKYRRNLGDVRPSSPSSNSGDESRAKDFREIQVVSPTKPELRIPASHKRQYKSRNR